MAEHHDWWEKGAMGQGGGYVTVAGMPPPYPIKSNIHRARAWNESPSLRTVNGARVGGVVGLRRGGAWGGLGERGWDVHIGAGGERAPYVLYLENGEDTQQ